MFTVAVKEISSMESRYAGVISVCIALTLCGYTLSVAIDQERKNINKKGGGGTRVDKVNQDKVLAKDAKVANDSRQSISEDKRQSFEIRRNQSDVPNINIGVNKDLRLNFMQNDKNKTNTNDAGKKSEHSKENIMTFDRNKEFFDSKGMHLGVNKDLNLNIDQNGLSNEHLKHKNIDSHRNTEFFDSKGKKLGVNKDLNLKFTKDKNANNEDQFDRYKDLVNDNSRYNDNKTLITQITSPKMGLNDTSRHDTLIKRKNKKQTAARHSDEQKDSNSDGDENEKNSVRTPPGVSINFYFHKGGESTPSDDYSIKLSTDSSSENSSNEEEDQKKSGDKTEASKNNPLKLYHKWLKLEDKSDHEHHAEFDHQTVSSNAMEEFLYKQLTSKLLDPLKQEDDPFVTIQKLGLSTFTRLLQITGLDHKLKNTNRNFTIFTPTDTAFRRLSTDHRKFLSVSQNMERLLLFHVCPGRVFSHQFKLRRNLITMYNRSTINLKTSFNTQTMLSITSIQSSNVMGSDIISNGSVIHVIDKVLFYPSKSVLETIESDHRFKLFSYFLKNTTMRAKLANETLTFTVFIPKDSVILSTGYFLFYQNNEDRLDFLHNHIYPDSVMYSNNFEEGIEYQLFMNRTRVQKILTIRRIAKDQIKLGNRVYLIEKDLISTNGVIHTVDGILS